MGAGSLLTPPITHPWASMGAGAFLSLVAPMGAVAVSPVLTTYEHPWVLGTP